MGVTALAADALLVEPNHPRLVRLEIALRRLPPHFDGFTIAQLSDFHYDPYFSARPIDAAVRMTSALQPHMIVLTGDFVSAPISRRLHGVVRATHHIESCAEILGRLSAPHGVWGSLGNHDTHSDPNYIEKCFERSGIHVLRNAAVPVERNGGRFWLAGVDDVLTGYARLDQTLRGIPSTQPIILMAHEPDFADHVAHYPVDLQLSGHSHGGQVRLPVIGAVYLPPLARKYPVGLRRIGDLVLYTNTGIGTLFVPVRWNCPPEVTLITLRTPQPHA